MGYRKLAQRFLQAMLVALSISLAVFAQEMAKGTVSPGATNVKVSVRVTNTYSDRALEPSLELLASPPWVQNVRITSDTTGPLAAGQARAFAVLFDIARDAPSGESGALRFRVLAPGDEQFDYPNPTVEIRIAGEKKITVDTGTGAPVAKNTEELQPQKKVAPPPPSHSGGPMVLKLVRVQNYLQGASSNQAGGFVEIPKIGSKELHSIKVTGYPKEIIVGKPFTISGEVKTRVSYADYDDCYERPSVPETTGRRAYLAITNVEAYGNDSLLNYCDGAPPGGRLANDRDGSVSLTLQFAPHQTAASGASVNYTYHLSYNTSGKASFVEIATGSPGTPEPNYREFSLQQNFATDAQGYALQKVNWGLSFTFFFTSQSIPAIELRYELRRQAAKTISSRATVDSIDQR